MNESGGLRLRVLASLALAVMLAAGSGCSQKIHRVAVPGSVKPQPAPAVENPPPEPAPIPPPSEADLAIAAAREAEARGDYAKAEEFYEHAASLPEADRRLADIHYGLAILYADPNSGLRNPEQSYNELQILQKTAPDHARAREAAALISLMDEVARLRGMVEQLKSELDGSRAQVTDLNAKLDEKEKELQRIKKVLLQNKP